MSVRDAEYVQRSHRVYCIPAHDPLLTQEFPRRAIEPRRLEQLPWPRNLFGELATIAELMAENGSQDADGPCLSIGGQEAC
jgi:hypothetical protein